MFAHVVTIAAVLFIGHSNAYKGWIKYPSGNLYFLFNKVPAPWDRAKKACILNGGYLAEPVNSAIDTFLRRQVSQRAAKDWWLGATDQHKEGEFIWQHSRTKMQYTNWHPDNPDNWRNQDCLQYWKGNLWDDVSCYENRPFICQKSKT